MNPRMFHRAWPAQAKLALFAEFADFAVFTGVRAASGSGGAVVHRVIASRGARPPGSGVCFVHAQDRGGVPTFERSVVVR